MAKLSALTWDMSTRDDANWSGWNTSRHSINAGRLQINVPGNTNGYYPLALTYVGDLTDSYVSVEVPGVLSGASAETQFVLKLDANNTLVMMVSQTSLVMRDRIGGTNASSAITYNSTNHRFWRFRESNGTVYWETSSNGTTFTSQRQKAISFNKTNLSVELTAGTYDTSVAAPGNALYDNLNLPHPRSFFTFLGLS